MKILHISTTDDGGAGKAAVRLHRGLLGIGVDSQMLVKQSTSGAPGIFPFVPQKPTLRVRLHDEIRRRRLHRDLARYTEGRPVRRGALSDDRTLLDLSRHPLIRAADVIHLHWIAQFVDFTALFSSVTGKPIVWTLHDMHPFTGGCHYAGDCLKYERSCGDCPQLASSDDDDLSHQSWQRKNRAYNGQQIHVVSPSTWLATKAQQSTLFGRCTVNIIPYGIPINIFHQRNKFLCRELLELPQDKTIVLFVAADAMTERKGARYLKDALNILAKSIDTSKVALAVCGSRAGMAFEETEVETYLLGHIRDERLLAACYSAADVFVIPSLEDNLPNTVLESMACGTPVVGFDSGGIPEMIQHLRTGMLARERDAHDLAEKLSWILVHPQEREVMGTMATATISHEYTQEVQAERYLAVYQQL